MDDCQVLINQQDSSSKFHLRLSILSEQHAVHALNSSCDLSKASLKKAMQAGCVWLKRQGCKTIRIRKARNLVLPGDIIDFYYDRDILNTTMEIVPVLVKYTKDYSIWYKPANILTQGSRFGDHLSLTRYAEKYLNLINRLHLIHRLDRETFGLVLIAHNRMSAADLSGQLASSSHTKKRYWARVNGKLQRATFPMQISTPLDGKESLTIVSASRYNQKDDTSELFIEIRTGRFHQIRRHLSAINHPICGDYRYGNSRKAKSGLLQLCAWQLCFQDPETTERIVASLPEELLPFNRG